MHRLAELGRQLTNTKLIQPINKLTIQGRFIIIEPINSQKHATSLYRNYLETPDALSFATEEELTTLEEFKQRCLKKEKDLDEHWFVVSRTSSPSDYIAMACLRNIDTTNRKLEIVALVASQKGREEVVVVEAMYLLALHCFDELNYNRMSARIHPWNLNAIRSFKNLGWSIEGLARDATFHNSRPVSYLVVSLVASRWPSHK